MNSDRPDPMSSDWCDVAEAPPLDRMRPLTKREVAEIETLCNQAIPGPFVSGDLTDGDGLLLATLADGRPLVSLGFDPGETVTPEMTEATLRLFCRARYLLLRLLGERTAWSRQREQLLEQIEQLQARLDGKGAPETYEPVSLPRQPR